MSRIGVDISDLHAGRADGTTRFTYEIAKRLPAMAPGNEWIYFSSGEPSESYQLPATSYKLAVSKWPRFWTQSRLWLDLYKHRPDVLLMPIQQLPYIRPGRMKTACVVHDLAWHKFPEYFTYKDWALQNIFTAHVAREADNIIAVSKATADDLDRYYGRTKNVHVVHHGLDHERFRPPASDVEKEKAWQQLLAWQPTLKKPYVLYVGQIQPRKNLVRLIESFELLKSGWRAGGPPPAGATAPPGGGAGRDRTRVAQLVLAGGHGWLNTPIYKKVKESSASDSILMPGRVPDELLPALYWHAEVFALPSLYEGFGLPLVEAMACGTPVVTSTVSCMPEVAGNAAILVDPTGVADIARGLADAQTQRATLREAGIARAAAFTWERTTEQILSILTKV